MNKVPDYMVHQFKKMYGISPQLYGVNKHIELVNSILSCRVRAGQCKGNRNQ